MTVYHHQYSVWGRYYSRGFIGLSDATKSSSWETLFREKEQSLLLTRLMESHPYEDGGSGKFYAYHSWYLSDPPVAFLSGKGLTCKAFREKLQRLRPHEREREERMEEERRRKANKHLISRKGFLKATRAIDHPILAEKLRCAQEHPARTGTFVRDPKHYLATRKVEDAASPKNSLRRLYWIMTLPPFSLRHITLLEIGNHGIFDLHMVGMTPAGNLLGVSTAKEMCRNITTSEGFIFLM